MTTPFFGFASDVWSVAYRSIQYLSDQLAVTTNVGDVETAAKAVMQTMLNGCAKINAFNYSNAWQQELANMQAIQALPISLTPFALTVLNNRAQAYVGAIAGVVPLIAPVDTATIVTLLSQGNAAIPDPGYLEFYQNFNYELSPFNTLDYPNFNSEAASIPTAFASIASVIQIVQGIFLTQAFDCANRLTNSAQVASNIINSCTSSPVTGTSPIQTWNQIVTLPAMVTNASLLSNAPYSLAAQQNCVIRNTMLTMAQQIAHFLLILRNPQTTKINLAVVNHGDTLMDIAARYLGDFEQWQAIAALNNLVPPYIGPFTIPGVAGYGSKIVLPNSTTSLSAVGSTISYINNFLGVDLYLGPIDEPMLAWAGDFQVISGYQNLKISLGRRLQTTLGSLIYHSDYGSRIPPEIGNIESTDEAVRIATFGRSALLSDPRVQSVLNVTAQQMANYQIAFQGTVIPAGLNTTTINLNEVIGPA